MSWSGKIFFLKEVRLETRVVAMMLHVKAEAILLLSTHTLPEQVSREKGCTGREETKRGVRRNCGWYVK